MRELAGLIERLEKATGPDREIDALIEIEARRQEAYRVGLNDDQRAKWKPVGSNGEVEEGGTRYHSPKFTASLDATVALIERVLPGCEFSLTNLYGVAHAELPLNRDNGWENGRRTDGNLAIAMLIALLRALSERQE